MGSGLSFPADKHVVVVGGGYGGALLCMDLQRAGANFTLIDPKPFFFHNVATVRAVVDPKISDQLFIQYEKSFGERFKQGRVKDILAADKKTVLESGEEVAYDVLVLATGSESRAPYKTNTEAQDEDSFKQMFESYAGKIKEAGSVVLIGGGPVGCEIAAEIKHLYKDKDVTLIHNSEELIYKGAPAKFQTSMKSKLKNMGVKLVLGSKVTNLDAISDCAGQCDVSTQDGAVYSADLVLICIGNTAINLDYAQNLGKEAFNESGLLHVNEHMLVNGHDNVFALGDCCDADVVKLALVVKNQREVLFKNIGAMLSQTSLAKYTPEKGPHYPIGVSLGPKDGVFTMKGYVFPAFLLVKIKCRDMMVGQFWKDMGQTLPQPKPNS